MAATELFKESSHSCFLSLTPTPLTPTHPLQSAFFSLPSAGSFFFTSTHSLFSFFISLSVLVQRFPSVSLAVLFGSLCPPSHSLSFLSPRSALCPASFPESPSALALFSFLALSCFSILALPPSLPLSFSSGQRASSSSLAPSQLLSSSSPPPPPPPLPSIPLASD